jgi:hypothetical protein
MCNRPIVRFLPRKDIRQPAILKVCLPQRAMTKWFSATFIAMRLRSWPGFRTSLAPCAVRFTTNVSGQEREKTAGHLPLQFAYPIWSLGASFQKSLPLLFGKQNRCRNIFGAVRFTRRPDKKLKRTTKANNVLGESNLN